MPMPSEHKALVFVGAIAVLGAGVRVARSATAETAVAAQPALDRQLRSADSAVAATARGRGRGRAPSAQTPADTTKRRRAKRSPRDSATPPPVAPLDRKGWIHGRLDLDVATAAQIDSLPGVTPAMAKRIVADRLVRGPFLTLERLRRVSGAGPKFLERIDSLVIFSGTVVQPDPNDTVIPRRRRGAKSAAPGPAP